MKITKRIWVILVITALLMTLAPMASLAEESPAPAQSATVTVFAVDALPGDADKIGVPYGTPRADITFPAITVNGTALDGVVWECLADYKPDMAGEYLFAPTLPTDRYTLAENAVLPTVAVTVQQLEESEETSVQKLVTSVSEYEILAEAEHGTPKEALPLPGQITVVADGEEQPVSASWGCESYDAQVSGEYTFVAALPDGYELVAGVLLSDILVTVLPELQTQEAMPQAGQTYTIDLATFSVGDQDFIAASSAGLISYDNGNNFTVKAAGTLQDALVFKNAPPGNDYIFTFESGYNFATHTNVTFENVAITAMNSNASPVVVEAGVSARIAAMGANSLMGGYGAPAIKLGANSALTVGGTGTLSLVGGTLGSCLEYVAGAELVVDGATLQLNGEVTLDTMNIISGRLETNKPSSFQQLSASNQGSFVVKENADLTVFSGGFAGNLTGVDTLTKEGDGTFAFSGKELSANKTKMKKGKFVEECQVGYDHRINDIMLGVDLTYEIKVGKDTNARLDRKIASTDKSATLTKSGDGELLLTGDNSWYNGVFNLESGKVVIDENGAIFGGSINLLTGTELKWQGGAKDEYNKPQITLNGNAKLFFELDNSGGGNDKFSFYGTIKGDKNSSVSFEKGEVYIKGDCSEFKGNIKVEDGAYFEVRRSLGRYEGKMFSGTMKVNGSAVIDIDHDLEPLNIAYGTVTIDNKANLNKTTINQLTVGEDAAVIVDVPDTDFQDTTIHGDMDLRAGTEATFKNLDIDRGLLRITGSGLSRIVFNGYFNVGSGIESTTTNHILLDASTSNLQFYDNRESFIRVKNGTTLLPGFSVNSGKLEVDVASDRGTALQLNGAIKLTDGSVIKASGIGGDIGGNIDITSGTIYLQKSGIAPGSAASFKSCTVFGPGAGSYAGTYDANGNRIVQDNNSSGVVSIAHSSPKTGDEANLSLWIALCMAAGVSIAGAAIYRKRKA